MCVCVCERERVMCMCVGVFPSMNQFLESSHSAIDKDFLNNSYNTRLLVSEAKETDYKTTPILQSILCVCVPK